MASLGWTVLYNRPETDERPKAQLAAIVTRVRQDNTVDLLVFEPNCLPVGVEAVAQKLLDAP